MEIYQDFNLDNVSPYLRFIHVDDVQADAEYSIPWRCIYDYEMIFLTSGQLFIETEHEKYTLNAGELHIMPPFLHHKRTGTGPLFLYSMHFDLFYMGKNNDFSAVEVYSKPIQQQKRSVEDDSVLINRPFYALNNFELPNKLKVSNEAAYRDIFSEALYIFGRKTFGSELDLKILILRILKNIISDMHSEKIHQKLSKHDRTIIYCIDQIKGNFTQKIDIDQMAEDAALTPNYFRRLFKRITNKSPNEYIIDLRIEQAIDLMKTGIYTVSEIANKVGYDDIHYFSRLFKAKKGVSPTNFLNR